MMNQMLGRAAGRTVLAAVLVLEVLGIIVFQLIKVHI
jgi:hypothetical protein